MKRAIVGSVSLAGNDEAYQIINDAFSTWNPDLLISGGAAGIDSMAEEIAEENDVPTNIFLPKTNNWENGYKPRNLKIAKACDVLIRIVAHDSSTYGSGWTRDRAREMGKHTEEYVVRRKKW
jgi:hypothetical protein